MPRSIHGGFPQVGRCLALAGGLAAVLGACSAEAPRSVLLITVDTLRADHLSAYDYEIATSPGLESLAARGVRFEHAFSASSATAPSIASILTGRYPSFHTVGLLNGIYRLHPSATTLAEILEPSGYHTGAIVSNPVLLSSLGLDQGFASYDDRIEGRELNREIPERYADRAVDLALEWLAGNGARPFFLWLHLQDPHGPYTPPSGWARSSGRASREAEASLPAGTDHSGYGAIPAYQIFHQESRIDDYQRRYDSEIAFLDHQLDRLLAHLAKEQGLYGNTLVLLTADHGEAFGEDGFYFSHSHSVGLDQVRVPLILIGPEIRRAQVISNPVSNVDVFATVLGFLNLKVPETAAGSSLLRLLDSPGQPRERTPSPIFFESLSQTGIAFGNIFLRRDRRPPEDHEFWLKGNPNSGGFWKPLGREVVHLFDPTESTSVTPKEAEALLDSFEESARAARRDLMLLRNETPVPPEMEKTLRSLGYLQ